MDQTIVEKIQGIAVERPTYGTRRMAAMLERTLSRPVNRKQVQRIYRKLAWIKAFHDEEGHNRKGKAQGR